MLEVHELCRRYMNSPWGASACAQYSLLFLIPWLFSNAPPAPFILVGIISLSSCLWQVMVTFIDVARTLSMTYLHWWNWRSLESILTIQSPSWAAPSQFTSLQGWPNKAFISLAQPGQWLSIHSIFFTVLPILTSFLETVNFPSSEHVRVMYNGVMHPFALCHGVFAHPRRPQDYFDNKMWRRVQHLPAAPVTNYSRCFTKLLI